MSIRVVIADDHHVIRVGVRMALEKAGGFSIVGEATNAAELLELAASTSCDVIVTDLTMPSDEAPDGVALLRELTARYPQTRTVVFTSAHNMGILQALTAAGAYGVLEKTAPLHEVPKAVMLALGGHHYFSSGLKRRLDETGLTRSDATRDVPSLSPRQLDIVRLLVLGMSNVEISRKLGLSHKTISRHKRDAMAKLSIQSESDLYDATRRLGLIV